MWALGVTGTYLGDYFGILMEVRTPSQSALGVDTDAEGCAGEGGEFPVQCDRQSDVLRFDFIFPRDCVVVSSSLARLVCEDC